MAHALAPAFGAAVSRGRAWWGLRLLLLGLGLVGLRATWKDLWAPWVRAWLLRQAGPLDLQIGPKPPPRELRADPEIRAAMAELRLELVRCFRPGCLPPRQSIAFGSDKQAADSKNNRRIAGKYTDCGARGHDGARGSNQRQAGGARPVKPTSVELAQSAG